MRRILVAALVLGVCSLAGVGCAEKSKTEKKTTVETPNGKTTTRTETETRRSGDNPPPAK